MSQSVSPLAGKPAPASILVDVKALLSAYRDRRPDPKVAAQRVSFGTSGHRGSSFDTSFNEWHVLAITQAICDFRRSKRSTARSFSGSTPTRCRNLRVKAPCRCWPPTKWSP